MNRFSPALHFIYKVTTLGVRGTYKDSENRITLFSNLMAYWSIISLLPIIFFLIEQGIPFTLCGPLHLVLIASSLLVLFLNHKKQYLFARLLGLTALNLCGWQAALLFGKSFNGYWLFFIGMAYAIIAFASSSRTLRVTTFLVSFISFPIFEYLSHTKFLPITGFHSENFGLSVTIIDSLSIPALLAILMFVEKLYSLNHEKELERMNLHLEELVQERTTSLLKSKEENIQTAVMKSQFLSNVSHELRTPVQAILGYAELGNRHLEKKSDPQNGLDNRSTQQMKKNYQQMSDASNRLMDLLQRLLIMTRHGDQEIVARPVSFELWPMLNASFKHLSWDNRRLEPQLFELQNLQITTDETLLQQAIHCLLENAIQYSEENSSITVQGRLQGDTVEILVTNKGLGIQENEITQIFEAFFQGSRSDMKTGGTGIGLTLCRKYISTIGGTVNVVDPSSSSTTFKLSFPLRFHQENTKPITAA